MAAGESKSPPSWRAKNESTEKTLLFSEVPSGICVLNGIVSISNAVELRIKADAVRPDAVRPDAVRPDAVRPEAIKQEAIRATGASTHWKDACGRI